MKLTGDHTGITLSPTSNEIWLCFASASVYARVCEVWEWMGQLGEGHELRAKCPAPCWWRIEAKIEALRTRSIVDLTRNRRQDVRGVSSEQADGTSPSLWFAGEILSTVEQCNPALASVLGVYDARRVYMRSLCRLGTSSTHTQGHFSLHDSHCDLRYRLTSSPRQIPITKHCHKEVYYLAGKRKCEAKYTALTLWNELARAHEACSRLNPPGTNGNVFGSLILFQI
ncbi:hypothetical protein NMY22_g7172 [Coprinellus aureogranulatus]|nr:hypothetical protein NMY22_g7172 [Coprinellus aureogranulatus]